MTTGFDGTFVVPWDQITLDGASDLSVDALDLGMEVVWHGTANRLDGPTQLAVLTGADGVADLHARAARMAQRLQGKSATPGVILPDADTALLDETLVLTDGREAYSCAIIQSDRPLVVFYERLPPADKPMWVARIDRTSKRCAQQQRDTGVICFAEGTRIATPRGPVPIELLQEGDLVLTQDDGPQPLKWKGAKRFSGAALHAMPHLRPVRIRASSVGIDRPDEDLLVSPAHRVVVSGPAAQALFGEREVLVSAMDLTEAPGIGVDLTLSSVTYVHLAFDRHHIISANRVPSEAFDPAAADLGALDENDRERLFHIFPELRVNAEALGAPARRVLKTSEAAILGHRLH